MVFYFPWFTPPEATPFQTHDTEPVVPDVLEPVRKVFQDLGNAIYNALVDFGKLIYQGLIGVVKFITGVILAGVYGLAYIFTYALEYIYNGIRGFVQLVVVRPVVYIASFIYNTAMAKRRGLIFIAIATGIGFKVGEYMASDVSFGRIIKGAGLMFMGFFTSVALADLINIMIDASGIPANIDFTVLENQIVNTILPSFDFTPLRDNILSMIGIAKKQIMEAISGGG